LPGGGGARLLLFFAAVFFSQYLAAVEREKKSPGQPRRDPENIFAFLHIFLASEKNKRILQFADWLHATG
jgi:hypothetical protein